MVETYCYSDDTTRMRSCFDRLSDDTIVADANEYRPLLGRHQHGYGQVRSSQIVRVFLALVVVAVSVLVPELDP